MDPSTPAAKTLRLLPGLIAAGFLLLRFAAPAVAPGYEGFRVAILAGLAGVLTTFLWWTLLSRVPHRERWGLLLLFFLSIALVWRFNHPSMGLMWALSHAIPLTCLAWVAGAWAYRRHASAQRQRVLAATLLLTIAPWLLLRLDGLAGDHSFQYSWRWAPTGEEGLLAQDTLGQDIDASSKPPGRSGSAPGITWPGFRGPRRDGRITGTRIATDWSIAPPVELWRRPVGPGWSSFAFGDGLLFTQEQRGEEELVSCYRAESGEPVWQHRDRARFFEAMGGPGPRATPALAGTTIYSLGATGILNALDAINGDLIWSRRVADDTGSDPPTWGFAGSPLVLEDRVLIAAAGRLVAYERTSGDLLWQGPDGGESYSSPHPAVLGGVPQILLASKFGIMAVEPTHGQPLWDHAWSGVSLVQPALLIDGGLLLTAGEGKGLRRLDVGRLDRAASTGTSDGWKVRQGWESTRLKPNFSDFVVHQDHAYGFDGRILACIDLATGQRQWKGGRFGHGQLLLLATQDLLLVLSETGELALVQATPEAFAEVARAPAINGKTWNHPVLVDDFLLLRNSQEMAAFRLPSPGT